MCNNLFLCTDLLRLISIQCTSVIWFFFLQFRIKEKSLHMFVYFKLSCHRILNSQSMYTASEMKQINHLNVWLLRWESTTNWFELREKDLQPVRLVAVKYQYRAIYTFFLNAQRFAQVFFFFYKTKGCPTIWIYWCYGTFGPHRNTRENMNSIFFNVYLNVEHLVRSLRRAWSWK